MDMDTIKENVGFSSDVAGSESSQKVATLAAEALPTVSFKNIIKTYKPAKRIPSFGTIKLPDGVVYDLSIDYDRLALYPCDGEGEKAGSALSFFIADIPGGFKGQNPCGLLASLWNAKIWKEGVADWDLMGLNDNQPFKSMATFAEELRAYRKEGV